MRQSTEKKRSIRSSVGLVVAGLFALTISQVVPANAKSANAVDRVIVSTIAADNLRFELALARGDSRAAVSLYEPSAVFVGPGPRILIGRTQIQVHIAKILTKARFLSGTCRTDHLSQDGDQAYEAGHCSSIVEIDGRKITSRGDYLTVWRRQKNGTWLIEINAAP